MIPTHAGQGREYCNAAYDKLWAAAQDMKIPLSFHTSSARAGPGQPTVFAADRERPDAVAFMVTEDYWVRRRYHHTISAPLVYAVREALTIVEEEGLQDRWARHQRHHLSLAAGLAALGLSLLPPAGERLWTLNAVRVPDGVDEAAVRRRLLDEFSIEIGAGLGPLAGRIWRVGLMGAGSTLANVTHFLTALEHVLSSSGHTTTAAGAAVAAAVAAAAQ